MALSAYVRVMISSRCNDRFTLGDKNSPTLSTIRKELKRAIEGQQLFGKKAFEVWINEEAPPGGGTWDSWETCLNAVKDCDILLALYNGNAGWAGEAGEIGICHDELSTAYSTAPGKVRLIALPAIPVDGSAGGIRNQRFQEYFATRTPFRGGEVNTVEDLKQRVRDALCNAVVSLTQSGVLEASRGKGDTGQALDWNRMNFIERQAEMVNILRDAIRQRSNSKELKGRLFVSVDNQEVLFVPEAVPAAMSVAAAREMVGQPFLRDHIYADALSNNRGGPVHLIGCHKTISEAQAIKLLGFPDATVVTTPFGVYVADKVQKIQLVLMANCLDEANTRQRVQRFFEWLRQTGEGKLLAQRAAARARIVTTIANEMPQTASGRKTSS
jgi:Domain of unknown function (DUF4062)